VNVESYAGDRFLHAKRPGSSLRKSSFPRPELARECNVRIDV